MRLTNELPNIGRSSQPQSPSISPTGQVWDSLSKIWLTKRALKELDRRNRSAEIHRLRLLLGGYRPLIKRRRPLTRRILAELRRDIQSHNTPASHFLRGCDPAALGDVQAFARHGGPDLLDLRGYPSTLVHRSHETMISSLSTQQRGRKRRASESESSSYYLYETTKRSRSTGAYDANFRQRMVDDRIFYSGYRNEGDLELPEPWNWDELQQMLAARRRSLSSYPKESYVKFKRADDEAQSEEDVMNEVIQMIQGTARDRYFTAGNVPFLNLANMMRGASHAPTPDRFYGARAERLHRDVRDKLAAFVIPAKQCRPIAPNFFVEAKSPSASLAVALNQACIAGAVGARGMHSLQTYGDQTPRYDNKAYTLSATYHFGTLKIYSHHVSQPRGPGTQPEYYMHQLYAWALTASKESLIQGITAFRNAESWTEAQRNAAIDHANVVANRYRVGDAATADPTVDSLAPQTSTPQKLTKWWTSFF